MGEQKRKRGRPRKDPSAPKLDLRTVMFGDGQIETVVKASRPKPVKPGPYKRAGAPTLYDPAFCERVVEMGHEGMLVQQWAAALGVAVETLRLWGEAHPEFLAAKKEAKAAASAWWIEKARERGGITDKGQSPALLIFLLKNVAGMSDKAEVEHTGDPKKPIAIEQKSWLDLIPKA